MAQTCIDMKVQHHINTRLDISDRPNTWYRCKRVEFADETVTWELSQSSSYNFLKAYQKNPHRQLIQARDDRGLQTFVKAWGPIRGVALNGFRGTDPIRAYREVRDRLTAISRLLASVEQPEMRRSALLGFWKISTDLDSAPKSLLEAVQTELPMAGDSDLSVDENLHQWLDALTEEEIETATVFTVSAFPPLGLVPRFTVEGSKGRRVLGATPGIHTLIDALDWMVWQDVVQNQPIQFCVECHSLIVSTNSHARKFCSPQCAHRRTGRMWQQQKRKKERKTNGTQKTR